jgi:hypothetical protein
MIQRQKGAGSGPNRRAQNSCSKLTATLESVTQYAATTDDLIHRE